QGAVRADAEGAREVSGGRAPRRSVASVELATDRCHAHRTIGAGLRSSPKFTYTTCASVTSTLRSASPARSDSQTTFTVIDVLPMRSVSVQKLTRSPTKTGS